MARKVISSAYRELELILKQALKAFAATRQKLNPYERGVRDRIATIAQQIEQHRLQRELGEPTVSPEPPCR